MNLILFERKIFLKVYIKIFVVAFVAFMSIMAGAYYALDNHYTATPNNGTPVANNGDTDSTADETNNGDKEPSEPTKPEPVDNRTELEKLVDDSSNRVNIIAFGLNGYLADTMMFISLDLDHQKLDVISIPRDTYYPIEGFSHADQKKMNAIYSFKDEGGSNGMKKYVSEFLGVPVDYYVKVNFKAVEAVVNVLGGYEVTVPPGFVYDDDYADPPLHINLAPGYQTLDGKDTVKFLRFRKNNDGSVKEGDIQRIPRQQRFVKTMISKALSSKLPSVINTVMKYVKTDMTIDQALGYTVKIAGITSDDIAFHTVEGDAKMMNHLSYWIHDPAKLEELLVDIYKGNDPDASDAEKSDQSSSQSGDDSSDDSSDSSDQ